MFIQNVIFSYAASRCYILETGTIFFRADVYIRVFLLPNAKQAQRVFAHCLFMYRNVTFLAEYDLIWNFCEYFRNSSRAWLRPDYPRASLSPLSPPPPFAFAT